MAKSHLQNGYRAAAAVCCCCGVLKSCHENLSHFKIRQKWRHNLFIFDGEKPSPKRVVCCCCGVLDLCHENLVCLWCPRFVSRKSVTLSSDKNDVTIFFFFFYLSFFFFWWRKAISKTGTVLLLSAVCCLLSVRCGVTQICHTFKFRQKWRHKHEWLFAITELCELVFYYVGLYFSRWFFLTTGCP